MGAIDARQVPKPICTRFAAEANAEMLISSPSTRKVRVSPVGKVIGWVPPWVISRRLPRLSAAGPEMVPLPRRSPGRKLQPLEEWCAIICATVQ